MTTHPSSFGMKTFGFYILTTAAIILVLAVLLTSMGLLVLYSVESKHITETAIEKQVERAHVVATDLNNYLKNTQQLVQTTAQVVQPFVGNLPQTEVMLQQILSATPTDVVYGVGAWFEPSKFTDGVKYVAPYVQRDRQTSKPRLTYEWATPEYDYLNQNWYLQGKQAQGKLIVTEPYFDTFTVFVSLCHALFDESRQIIGIVSMDIELSLLSDLIKQINTSPSEAIYVTTAQGKLFLHPYTSDLLKFAQEKGKKVTTVLDVDEPTVTEFQRANGLNDVIDNSVTVELSGWIVHISSDQTYLFKEVTALRNSILSTIAVLWTVTLILLPIFRHTALRAKKAAEATARLEQEIMERQQKQVFLQEMNVELEARVRNRTSELSKANAEIQSLLRRLEKDNLRMVAELNITRQLQQMILPPAAELAKFEKLDIAGFMEPATEVGGDYYDVLDCNGHVVIGIGDVTGHGLASGVLMLMVQTAVRALTLDNACCLEECLGLLNRAIYKNVQRMDTDKNLTLMLLDYKDGKLVVCGQHEEVIVIRRNGEVERIDTFDLGFMIGLEPDISQFITRCEITLQPGDGIVLYTDGVTEAKNSAGEMYGVERLCRVLEYHCHLTATQLQQAVITNVKAHLGTNEVADDITLLILKRR